MKERQAEKLTNAALARQSLPEEIRDLPQQLASQDNRSTTHPMFCVCQTIGGKTEVVTVCFTNIAAEAYIERNGCDLTSPHVYVESGHRNPEWIAVRNWLLSLYDTETSE